MSHGENMNQTPPFPFVVCQHCQSHVRRSFLEKDSHGRCPSCGFEIVIDAKKAEAK